MCIIIYMYGITNLKAVLHEPNMAVWDVRLGTFHLVSEPPMDEPITTGQHLIFNRFITDIITVRCPIPTGKIFGKAHP